MRRSVNRYLVVGVANTILDIAIFSVLAVAVGLPPLLANVISTLIVVTISFFLNRSWVFASQATGIGTYAGFVAITLFSALVVQSAVILGALATQEAIWPGLSEAAAKPAAKVLAVGCGMVVNFAGYRWLFARPGRAQPTAPAFDPESPSP